MGREILEMRWIILSLVFIWNISYSIGQPQPKPAQPHTATKTEQYGTDEKPLTVKILSTPDAETKAAKEEQYREEKASEDRAISVATIWLAGITTVLAFFTATLWLSTRKLVMCTEKTAHRQLRAHVFPESVEISNIGAFDASGNDCVKIRIKNYGQTPAYKCTCERKYDIFDFPVRIFPELKISPNDPAPSLIDIPPGGFYETSITYKRPANDVRSDVINGIKAIYVYGVIEYEDAFGGQVQNML